ncbi:DUF4178 domain-containing protein [Aquimarina brevivitae]|uniref:Uncharacterized protein DUF4178 n=1 Tax=Aquimarina brevivitae TaxID=323412 RepID=A0A4Q7PJJ4_9FLAO|nr:DUF4178 domain-containing protein [Aquimarina brevivitae]RZT00001.1 uncharacterized protein DUF4178 [Aquimarina brevivitae]
MGLFDFFKKNRTHTEPHYDVTNIRVTDLEKDYIFEFDLDTWIVKKMYEYDWGNSHYSREFLVHNGKKNLYLHIEEDDELEISITEKIGIRILGEHIKTLLQENGKPPEKITYQDIVYFLDAENPGFCRNVEDENWYEIINWTYLNADEDKLITIEQSGDGEFDATIGLYVPEFKISNILPQNIDE